MRSIFFFLIPFLLLVPVSVFGAGVEFSNVVICGETITNTFANYLVCDSVNPSGGSGAGNSTGGGGGGSSSSTTSAICLKDFDSLTNAQKAFYLDQKCDELTSDQMEKLQNIWEIILNRLQELRGSISGEQSEIEQLKFDISALEDIIRQLQDKIAELKELINNISSQFILPAYGQETMTPFMIENAFEEIIELSHNEVNVKEEKNALEETKQRLTNLKDNLELRIFDLESELEKVKDELERKAVLLSEKIAKSAEDIGEKIRDLLPFP